MGNVENSHVVLLYNSLKCNNLNHHSRWTGEKDERYFRSIFEELSRQYRERIESILDMEKCPDLAL